MGGLNRTQKYNSEKGSFFSFEETSLVVLNFICQRGMEGGLQSEPLGGMAQRISKNLAYPDIPPLDGEIHVFPTLRTFLWYLARIN